jgi:hypothetical protein
MTSASQITAQPIRHQLYRSFTHPQLFDREGEESSEKTDSADGWSRDFRGAALSYHERCKGLYHAPDRCSTLTFRETPISSNVLEKPSKKEKDTSETRCHEPFNPFLGSPEEILYMLLVVPAFTLKDERCSLDIHNISPSELIFPFHSAYPVPYSASST